MHTRWGRTVAVSALATVSLLSVATGQEYESAAGTPTISGTPITLEEEAFPIQAGDLVIVHEAHIILRSEPADGAERVAMLPQHQVLEATGRAVIRDGERWLELRYPVTDGVGWVADRWLIPGPATSDDDGTPEATSHVR